MIPNIDTINEEITFYAEEITQSMYRTYLGKPNKEEYTAVLNKFNSFFDWEIISSLRKIKWDPGDNSRALYYLKGYMIGQWYSYRSKELMDKINQLQLSKAIPWNGKKISIREARYILSAEELSIQSNLRHLVNEELNNVLYPEILDYYKYLNSLATELDYKNFIEAANDIRRYSVQELVEISEEYIEQSDELFNKKVEEFCRKDGYNFENFNLLSSFSTERALEDIKYLINQMGWSSHGIEIGWANSNQKYSSSFCVPLNIPGKIILVTSSGEGFNVHRHLYHEFGHGFHFMNTSPNLKYEFRRMGDHAVAEAYSALLESLMFNESWLAKRGYPKEIAKYAYYHRCYLIRKYWAKIKSELFVHLNGTYQKDNINYFNKWYSRTLNSNFDSMWWAFSLDDELNAASQMRGWLLSAQINEFLKERYGVDWFENRDAGVWLKELFNYGYKYNADEISKIIGYKKLDAKALIFELNRFKD